MSMSVWLLNAIFFAVLLEADLGRRKIGWFRVLRPLIAVVGIVPFYLTGVPTGGNNLAFQGVAVGIGALIGVGAHLFLSVDFAQVKGRPEGPGQPVSRAGVGYAAYWTVVFAARMLFVYGLQHWFPTSFGQFMFTEQISVAGLTDALIFMAIAMAVSRSVLLAVRGWRVTRVANGTRVLAGVPEPVTPGRTGETIS